MIKKYFVLVLLFFLTIGQAQSPEKFTYQSIIKNSSGYLLKNQDVGLRISVLRNSTNGIAVYSEEHFPTSNSNGLVTLIIGEGLTGDNFSDINWGDGEFFLKVEVDPDGGVNYTMNQTSQLLSVPYALYAENAKLNLLGQDFITLQDQTLTVNKVDLADDIEGILPLVNGGTGSSSSPMVGVITAADEVAARSVLGLGTAATTASTDYATAAQGLLADSAQQPPIEGAFVDGDKTKLDGIEALADVTDTANVSAAGALMESEVTNLAQVKAFDSSEYATALQGTKADGALQAANDLSDLNDAATARTNLGVDIAGTDNSTDISLDASSQDYIVLDGQVLTINKVDASTDIIGLANVAISGDYSDLTNVPSTAGAAIYNNAGSPALDVGITASEVNSLLGLGTAATTASTDYATAAQGLLADSSLQDATAFATAAQGAAADAALPAANVSTFGATLIDDADAATARATLGLGTAATTAFTDYATALQGTKADSAQQPPSEGAFADGDKTKLDNIESGAQVNVSGDNGNAAIYDNSGSPAFKSGVTKAEVLSLINVEDAADVTDTDNVRLAGALMDDEMTDLAGVKAVTISTLQVKPSEGAFADGDKTKLDNIESGADETDATNVLAAGAVMTTGDQTVAGEKTFSSKMIATNIVNLASAGVMTTVKGTLNVDEAVTLDSALDVTGDTSVSTFDSTGATSLATSGGAVNLASASVMTTVKGTLNVDEAVTLDSALDVAGDTSVTGLIATGKVITASGTTGNQTINAIAGSVNFGSSDTSVRVTNSFVDENSVIILTKGSQGTSGGTNERKLWVVPTNSGYFDINVDFSYGNETKMFFLVIN